MAGRKEGAQWDLIVRMATRCSEQTPREGGVGTVFSANKQPFALAAQLGSFVFRAGGGVFCFCFILSAAALAEAVKTESHKDAESTTGNDFWL